MGLKNIVLTAAIVLATAVACSSPSWAYCDVLKYSSGGATQQEALTKANNKGLVKVRQLNQKYGGRVKYETAAFNCTGGNSIVCTITQKYCVHGGGAAKAPKCPKGLVWNAQEGCHEDD
jgi:hypothetical protein